MVSHSDKLGTAPFKVIFGRQKLPIEEQVKLIRNRMEGLKLVWGTGSLINFRKALPSWKHLLKVYHEVRPLSHTWDKATKKVEKVLLSGS